MFGLGSGFTLPSPWFKFCAVVDEPPPEVPVTKSGTFEPPLEEPPPEVPVTKSGGEVVALKGVVVVFDAGCMPDVVDAVVVPVPGGGAFGYVVPLTGASKLIMLATSGSVLYSRVL